MSIGKIFSLFVSECVGLINLRERGILNEGFVENLSSVLIANYATVLESNITFPLEIYLNYFCCIYIILCSVE